MVFVINHRLDKVIQCCVYLIILVLLKTSNKWSINSPNYIKER